MAETTITIHLTEETGEIAYIGTATIAQGDTAHITRFEYFSNSDILEAVDTALDHLRELQQHPRQLKIISPASPPEDDNQEDYADPTDEEDIETDEPDEEEAVNTAQNTLAQLGLF